MQTQQAIQQDVLYAILVDWVRGKKPRTYTELSHAYKARTNEWHEPHGTWDRPLGDLNVRVHEAREAPAISALVVLKPDSNGVRSPEPGRAFWGSAPNVPPCPKTEVERLTNWAEIVKKVLAFEWPATLP